MKESSLFFQRVLRVSKYRKRQFLDLKLREQVILVFVGDRIYVKRLGKMIVIMENSKEIYKI